jgi:hypothetical protein
VRFNRLVINAVLFNVAWFGCILIGNSFIPMVLIWLVLHLRESPSRIVEFSFLLLATLIGSVIDSTLTYFEVFIFDEGSLFVIPLWLMFMWLSFALTINGCLAFLRHSLVWQFVAGLVIAPLSYIAGSALGAVEFGYSTSLTFVILSLLWSILLPFLYLLNQQIRAQYYVH